MSMKDMAAVPRDGLLPRFGAERPVPSPAGQATGAVGAGARYRAEIDGLRAVAVVLVLLYHAQFRIGGREVFAGGFIGVDIFLVISGYLIGGILLREMREGRFSLLRFYERRARRILPALYAMLLATIPAAWLLMLPGAMKDYGAALTGAVASASNILFWHEVSYDAADNLANPLIHTWSLGLEEQFYLLFPALLLLIHRHARRWMPHLLCGLCIASLLLAEIMTARAPDASFFLLPSRMWELAVGAVLALRAPEEESRAGTPSALLPLLGLGAILCSVPLMRVHLHHPGIATILPVLGAALIIRYSGRGDPVGRWLSSRPMVSVGLISYSLYLWHQPVFAFGRLIRADEPRLAVKAGWIALSVLLAVATFLWVERPTRDRRRVSSRTIWIIAFSGAALLAGTGIAIFMGKGLPGRFAPPLDAIARAERIEEASIFQNGKGCLNYVVSRGPCRFPGPNPAGYHLIVAGDSHARTLSNALIDRLPAAADLASLTFLNRGGCLMLPGLVRVDAGQPGCPDSYNEARMRYLIGQPRAIAVLMMRLPVVVERSRFDNGMGGVEPGEPPHISRAAGPYDRAVDNGQVRAAMAAMVRRLLDNDVKVLLIYPVPEMGWNIPRKLLEISRSQPSGLWELPGEASVSRQQFHDRTRQTYALLDSLGEEPDLARVYPEEALCRGQRCLSHDGTAIFYRDDNHLTRAGAAPLAEAIDRTIAARWGGR
ncbi:MAG: acyltransferase family protein [Sphingobium sp.]